MRKSSPTLVLLAVLCVVALAGATLSRFQDADLPGATASSGDAATARLRPEVTPQAAAELAKDRYRWGAIGHLRPLPVEGLTVNGISSCTSIAELTARGLTPPQPPLGLGEYTVVCGGTSHRGTTLISSEGTHVEVDDDRILGVSGTSLELDGQVIARAGERMDRLTKVFTGWELRRCSHGHKTSEIEFKRSDLQVHIDHDGRITGFKRGQPYCVNACELISQ